MSVTIPVLGAVTYEPIKPYRVNTGGASMPQIARLAEKATQTFKQGVPLKYNSGVLDEVTFSAADVIVGFSAEPGHNLTTADTPEPATSEGTAPNQASSRIIPVGAWMKDGKVGTYVADENTIFSAFAKNGPFTNSMMIAGTFYGLTKDNTSGFWYVDLTDTSGNNAVVELLGVDPSCPNTVADGVRVYFRIKNASRYYGQ